MVSKSAKSVSESAKSKTARSKCGPGKIKRSAYNRKAHERKSYSKTDRAGNVIRIRSSYVSRAHVDPACVPAKGKAILRGSKTPKAERILPKIGKEIDLHSFGYGTHVASKKRQSALEKASKKFGDLKVLRHLNLIRNYQADPSAKKVMSTDIVFLSGMHNEHLRKEGRRASGSKTSNKLTKTNGTKKSKSGSKSKSMSKSKSGSKSKSKKLSGSKSKKTITGGAKRKSKAVSKSKSKSGSKSRKSKK